MHSLRWVQHHSSPSDRMHGRAFFPGDRTREHTYPDDADVTEDEDGDREDEEANEIGGITSVFYDSNEQLSLRQ